MRNKGLYEFTNKDTSLNTYVMRYLNRTSTMFKYHNLPKSIPSKILERMLQTNGDVCIAKHNNELYAFTGGLGGELDVYYRPTIYTVANPALNLNKDFVIDQDCVIVKNDSSSLGLLPIIRMFSTLIVENELSILLATYSSRQTQIMSAGDNATIQSCMEYLNQIKKGKQGVILDNKFLESLSLHSASTNNGNVQDLINMNIFLKSNLYNELGLQSNTNLKKERLISAEVVSNSESLYPIIDDMLECRREGVEKVNEMFNCSIDVELNSSWDYRQLNGMSIHNVESEIELGDIENESNVEKNVGQNVGVDVDTGNGKEAEIEENLIDNVDDESVIDDEEQEEKEDDII